MEGKIGMVAPGAHADLIVVDGDPLQGSVAADRAGPAHAADHEGRRIHQAIGAIEAAGSWQ